MLCKDCSYYHALSKDDFGDSDASFCEFADMLFLDDVDNLEAEYPCKQISFGEYLQKQASGCAASAAGRYARPELFRELQECGVCMLKFPDAAVGKCFRGKSDSNARHAVLETSGARKK